MADINEWSFEKCKDWLNDNEPDPETDDVFDRAFYKEVKQRYRELLEDWEQEEEKVIHEKGEFLDKCNSLGHPTTHKYMCKLCNYAEYYMCAYIDWKCMKCIKNK